MALQLSTDSRSRRIDVPLPGGAVLALKPATSVEVETARVRLRRAITDYRAGRQFSEDYGLQTAPSALDETKLLGLGGVIFVTELVIECAISWDKVWDSTGAPAELNRANVFELLSQDSILDAVRAPLEEPLHKVVTEGNGFASSPNGASAAGSRIAEDAPDSNSAALGASAAPADNSVQR